MQNEIIPSSSNEQGRQAPSSNPDQQIQPIATITWTKLHEVQNMNLWGLDTFVRNYEIKNVQNAEAFIEAFKEKVWKPLDDDQLTILINKHWLKNHLKAWLMYYAMQPNMQAYSKLWLARKKNLDANLQWITLYYLWIMLLNKRTIETKLSISWYIEAWLGLWDLSGLKTPMPSWISYLLESLKYWVEINDVAQALAKIIGTDAMLATLILPHISCNNALKDATQKLLIH